MSSSNPKDNDKNPLSDLKDFGTATNSKASSVKGKPLETGNIFMGPKESRESVNMQNLNKKVSHKDIGTIFMGPKENRESTLSQLLNSDQTHLWTRNTEEEYLNRVKEKALVKVKALLTKAEERSKAIIQEAEQKAQAIHDEANANNDLAQNAKSEAQNTLQEAENIKAAAYDEGLNEGLHQAQITLDQAKSEFANATAYILMSIHEQCITIFDSWRKDLSELLLEAVETSTAYTLDANKTEILQALLEESVSQLLDKREYSIRIHPNNAAVLTEILETMHKDSLQNSRWNLTSDDSLEEGSIIVESPSGLIKNSIVKRQNFVKDILENLTLPLGDGDQKAYDTITQNFLEQAQKANIPLNQEESTSSETHNEVAAETKKPEPEPEPIQFDENQATEEEQAISQETLPPPELDKEEEASIAEEAQSMVDNELSFNPEDFVQEEMPAQIDEEQPQEEIPQTVHEEIEAQEEEPIEAQEKTTEYTEELADELLNEMGFK